MLSKMIELTADLDFGQILSYFKSSKPSIIIFRLKYPSVEKINKLLSSTLPKIEKEMESIIYFKKLTKTLSL